jgi:electron transport complex protein RnfG
MNWTPISRSMLKNSLLLGAFAVLSVGTVAAIQYSTAERIAVAERAAKVQALAQILPPNSYDNHLLDSVREVEDPLLGNKGPSPAYLATLNGVPAAVIVQATAPDGYSGSIHLLIGIFADGRIAGVRVLSHKETPGLGDKIELAKDRWISRFTGTSLSAPDDSGWAVKKDGGQFDQFAGATITPRAVVGAVHRALQYFNDQRATLLQPVEAGHD